MVGGPFLGRNDCDVGDEGDADNVGKAGADDEFRIGVFESCREVDEVDEDDNRGMSYF